MLDVEELTKPRRPDAGYALIENQGMSTAAGLCSKALVALIAYQENLVVRRLSLRPGQHGGHIDMSHVSNAGPAKRAIDIMLALHVAVAAWEGQRMSLRRSGGRMASLPTDGAPDAAEASRLAADYARAAAPLRQTDIEAARCLKEAQSRVARIVNRNAPGLLRAAERLAAERELDGVRFIALVFGQAEHALGKQEAGRVQRQPQSPIRREAL